MNQLAMLNCNLHISDRARLSARDKRDEDEAHGNGTVSKNGSYAIQLLVSTNKAITSSVFALTQQSACFLYSEAIKLNSSL